ncbi:GlcG/HbpS family heme-binding protein [Xanthobacter sp. TB0139]|uniref:GlcG/HbpS family heme-binding protein n=1 Tax=Xanthobacter sp. TB0139 TaxID=3459178 RepID=UPI00403A6245
MAISRPRRTICAEAARAAVNAAVAHGPEARKVPVVAAVVDASGDLIALLRGDGAFKASTTIAQDKAHTAAVFGVSTDALDDGLGAGSTLHQGIALRPGVALFGGGFPIVENGEVIGGIGVSGGSEDDDRACAQAGLAALGLATSGLATSS